MKDGQHFCSGAVCNDSDLATCCVLDIPLTTTTTQSPTTQTPGKCSSWGCPDGWEPIAGAVCAGAQCTQDDLIRCCQQTQPQPTTTTQAPTTLAPTPTPCSSWTCPDGYSMKDGQHFCSGAVCNDNDLATCCVLSVPVTTGPLSTVPLSTVTSGTTTPCSSTLPVTTKKQNWLPLAIALLPLVDQLRPPESTTTPLTTPMTTQGSTQGAQSSQALVVTTTEGSSGSSSSDNSLSDLWWLWLLLGLCALCCCLGLFSSALAAMLGMMGKKKKKSRSSHVEQREPQLMPTEVFVEREPLLTVPPLTSSAPQPTMMETVQLVPQPTLVETTQMVPALVETGVPVATSSHMTSLSMPGPTVPLAGGMMGSSMPASVSYASGMPVNPSYSMGTTFPGGVV